MVIISSDAQQQPEQARKPAGKGQPRTRRTKAAAEDGERIVAPTKNPSDSEQVEESLRPKRLSEYIGQASLKDFLDIAIQAARKRNEPLDHMLLYGPPGLGKTSMASVLAVEMGVNIRITSAPALERPRDIAGILIALKPHDILFIDEIHRLNRLAEEILYPAMEDFSLDITLGQGKTARIQRVPLKRFTLIGATTKAGALSSPLRDRFGHTYRVEFYQPEELGQVITRSASILKVPVTPEGAAVIAGRARGTPRIANRLLKRVRDFAQVKSDGTITADIARAALDLFRIDERGLDITDRQFLKVLIDNYDGGPVGIETMALAVSEDVGTIEDVYEPYLIQAGFLARTPRGRVATKAAYAHLGYGLFGQNNEQQGLGIGG